MSAAARREYCITEATGPRPWRCECAEQTSEGMEVMHVFDCRAEELAREAGEAWVAEGYRGLTVWFEQQLFGRKRKPA